MSRTRQVRLLLSDGQGHIAGVTPYRSTEVPWWQESGPLRIAFPEVFEERSSEGGTALAWSDRPAVLRLVEAEHDPGDYMGGRSTHLVEVPHSTLEDAATHFRLERWQGDSDVARRPQAHRHPWAVPRGPAADLEWVARQVDISGPPVQHRTWNLSAIWSIPSKDGVCWLKCVPPFFQHEPVVLAAVAEVAPGAAPSLLAADGHRQLMAEMSGRDGYEADTNQQIAMVDALVDLQLATIDRVDGLLTAGVPDMRTEALAEILASFLNRVAPDDEVLQRLAGELDDRLATVQAVGLPDVLVHGDPHPGNCRLGTDPPTWFDWGDSFIGNPLLDLGAVHRMSPPAVERWLQRWSERAQRANMTTSSVMKAWETLKPIALLRSAWVYQQFLDNIEQDEHIYHHTDVPMTLAKTRTLLSPTGHP